MCCETWTNEFSNVSLEGYVSVCKHRKRKVNAKRDSGGLVCYFSEKVCKGISSEPCDLEDGLCFKFDKSFFGWEKDVFLLFVYMRPISSSRNDMDTNVDCYELLFDELARVSDRGGVIVAGDMNARVGEREECIIEHESEDIVIDFDFPESDLLHEHDFICNGMSVERVNQDKIVNEYGVKLLQLCNTCDLAILNGRAGEDKNKGLFTFCNHRGESTIDLVMCDKSLFNMIDKFKVHETNVYSDHKIVSFCLHCVRTGPEVLNCNRAGKLFAKWDENKKGDFISRVGSDSVANRVNDLIEILSTNGNVDILEEGTVKVTEILVEAGNAHIKVCGNGREDNRGHSKEGNEWYNQDCFNQRGLFFGAIEKISGDRGSNR